ncbi:MAG: hypothetical protein A2033_19825 [Bacteroidetes bacterium GWA2_31_9]|nr:MAG: hypothetical protein A2033_19825 [Bacteroidetes bacterium GWA2_31_9]
MISKAKISFIKSLHSGKGRNEAGLFIAEGTKITNELLINQNIKIQSLYATNDFLEENNLLSNNNFEVFEISESELQKISLLSNPNKVLVIAEICKNKFDVSKLKNKLTIVLDNVQDPGNLGTIIRTMDWFGIKNLVCSETTVDVYNPKVIQATMGSFLRIKTHYVNLENFIKEYFSKYKYNIYGTLLNGKNIYKEQLTQEGLIVFGNESKGISSNIENFITNKISIPDFSKSKSIDSLNISIAAGIVFSEFKRTT